MQEESTPVLKISLAPPRDYQNKVNLQLAFQESSAKVKVQC